MGDGSGVHRIQYSASWKKRIQSAPSGVGPNAGWLTGLPEVLEALSGISDRDSLVALSFVDFKSTSAALAKSLGPTLIRWKMGILTLTPNATSWLANPSGQSFIELLHREVRYIGELLNDLQAGPLSHEELKERANAEYRMNWKSLDQIRRRTTWMRCAGLVDLYDTRLHLRPAGKELLARLDDLIEPPIDQRISDTTPTVAPPTDTTPAPISASEPTERQDWRSWYIPGKGTGSSARSLETVTRIAENGIDESELDRLCQESWEIKLASARQFRGCLHRFGLIERVTPFRWSTTDVAAAVLATGDPVGFVPIIHSKIRYVGELLAAMRRGPVTLSVIQQDSSRYFGEAMGSGSLRGRLTLFRDLGLVENLSWQEYQLTDLGLHLLENLELETPLSDLAVGADHVPSRPFADLNECAKELEAAARDSSNPDRFEIAVQRAFQLLGCTAEHVGGPGKTDVVVTIHEPRKDHTIAIDAKSSIQEIDDRAFSLERLARHRDRCSAELSLVIAHGFTTLAKSSLASDKSSSALEVDTLSLALRSAESSPMTADDLLRLCSPDRGPAEKLCDLEFHLQSLNDRVSHLEQLLDVFQAEWREPAADEGWMSERELLRELRHYDFDPSWLKGLLSMLSSDFLGVVESQGQRYRSLLTPKDAGRLLSAFGTHLALALGDSALGSEVAEGSRQRLK